MAFIRKKGKTKFMYLPVTASTALSANSLVAWSSGKLIAATSSTACNLIAGVLRHAIASTDDDYASERMVEVEVPVEMNVEWDFDGTSLSTSTRGTYLDITSSTSVNGGGSTYDIVFQTGYVSTTKGVGILNIGPHAAVK